MIVIEEISNQNMTREKIRQTLLKREDFWIVKLQTLEPHGFNDKLNFPQMQWMETYLAECRSEYIEVVYLQDPMGAP